MKNMYVWENVAGLTNNYHNGGGLVVIADNPIDVIELLRKQPGVQQNCSALTSAPTFTSPVDCSEDKVFIFPDAGCC